MKINIGIIFYNVDIPLNVQSHLCTAIVQNLACKAVQKVIELENISQVALSSAITMNINYSGIDCVKNIINLEIISNLNTSIPIDERITSQVNKLILNNTNANYEIIVI
jgi:hypothetical protein